MSENKTQVAIAEGLLRAKMIDVVRELVEQNVANIWKELTDAEDGKGSIKLSIALRLAGSRVYVLGNLGYARKYSDSSEAYFDLEDTDQGSLELQKEMDVEDTDTVTIKAGHAQLTMPRKQFSETIKQLSTSQKERDE